MTGGNPQAVNGWTYGWPISLLPEIEQSALFNAYNFSFSIWDPPSGATATINSTVGMTQIAALLCPSEDLKTKVNGNWGTINYMGNFGGPGTIQYFTGMIIPAQWSTGYSMLGAFGVEGVRDGTSNTSMFSERLHGFNTNITVYPGGQDFKRGMFKNTVTTTPNNVNNPAQGLSDAQSFAQACKNLPSTTASTNSNINGYIWCIGYPWDICVSSYTHFVPPNGNTCYNEGNAWGSGSGALPPTSNHSGGVNVGFADGSVKFVKDTIDLQTWWAIGTRRGGETVSADAY